MMARAISWLALTAFCMALTTPSTPTVSRSPAPLAPQSHAPSDATRAAVNVRMGKLPLRFEANAGQWDERVRFVARQGGATLFLTDEGMTVGLREVKRPDFTPGATPEEERAAREKSLSEAKTAAVTMKLVGAQKSAPHGEEELVAKSNFFLGNDKTRWRSNVPNYAQVRASGWAPGVDVVWHGGDDGLEYDLEVAPGVDASKLELEVEGATKLDIAADGALDVATAAGTTLVQRPPRVMQAGREVPTRYALSEDNHVRFVLKGYDARLAVLIDPALAYSTYLGAAGADQGNSVAVDGSGNAYVVGYVTSTNFPRQTPFQAVYGGGSHDAFVSKLNAAGSALVYSTYLGGSADDFGQAIAVDGSGSAYVTGTTQSADFPTQNPFQGHSNGDAFVSKLNASGSALVYSTYLGGWYDDSGQGIAVDASGNAYVTGNTGPNFPTKDPLQAASSGGGEGFLSKLNAAGSALVYSTYLGGSGDDYFQGVAVDGSGGAYVTGFTTSTNFPTKNPLQATFGGGAYDGFASKLNAAGSAFVFSTYLGGSGDDYGRSVTVDGSGSAYVTGFTASTNFPTQSPFQAALGGGGGDAFVTKLNAAGLALVFSTYLGGSGGDDGQSITVDGSGSAYVTGFTASTNFPTQSPFQAAFAGGGDAFVSKLNAAGSALVYSTYLGGSGTDRGYGIAVDLSGSAYVTGSTQSTNFPTLSPLQVSNGGGTSDAFVSRLARGPGEACAAPSQCGSGFCADGVCCNTACNGGGCDRCDLGGSLGTCTIAPVSDAGANPVCSPFACDGASGACPTSCASDATCVPDYYCAASGTCQARKAQAVACDLQKDCNAPGCRECATGNCSDGFCCDTTCAGQCEACDAVPGTCKPVDGVPHGARPACPSGRACDSKNASCSKLVATCDGDHATTDPDGTPHDCTPYKCDNNGACKPSCGSVSDCVAPNVCDPSGQCIAPPTSQDSGCAASPSSPSGAVPFVLIGLGALLARMRRRRTNRRS